MSTDRLENIYNFLKISDTIATAGQPLEEQFLAIKQAGYQVVVNLAISQSTNALANEQNIVEALQMEYVHIPVVWEKPTLENIVNFFATIEANVDRSIFVHCAANMRVSAFMYLYRLIFQQVNEAEARKDLERIWMPNETWQIFIQQVIERYQH